VDTPPSRRSLDQLRIDATAAGVVVALGILAMTVGLIRSESANDLRTLTATGASARTRRVLTAATAHRSLCSGPSSARAAPIWR
jgi:putative ABC transport system permease protein